MSRLRERLDEVPAASQTATRFPTVQNQYRVRCGECDGLFYVDGTTYDRVRRAVEFDPTNIPFRCYDCDEQYEEEEVS